MNEDMDVRIEDARLIGKLREHAAAQGVDIRTLIHTALQRCEELDLLKTVMARGPDGDPRWGEG